MLLYLELFKDISNSITKSFFFLSPVYNLTIHWGKTHLELNGPKSITFINNDRGDGMLKYVSIRRYHMPFTKFCTPEKIC